LILIYCLLTNLYTHQVDWDFVASKHGYNSGSTARVRFGQIKKKYASSDDGDDTATTTSKPTPSKPRAKNEKAEKGPGSGTNNGASKVTKPRATKKKSKAAETTEPMMGVEDEESGALANNQGGEMFALEAPKADDQDANGV
jgi:hypothetical protein